MNNIQIIFLFTSYQQLSAADQQQVRKCVQDAFAGVYHRRLSAEEISFADGMSETEKADVVLGIQRDNNKTNEADYRNRFATQVEIGLKKIPGMQALGFGGNVSWQDGLLNVNPAAADTPAAGRKAADPEDADPSDYRKRAKMYQAKEPKFTFNMLKLPKETMEQIDQALARIEYERKIFDEWGLYAIMPSPVAAMSFFGPAGTGKSLAAEAIASRVGKKIIRASYADIENKYVGEGPKNVCGLFLAAEEQDAVLLIDEADSLLSKRLVNVQEASGQAINSMRSQLLISLERFHGIVIFATNLVANYDAAFISRLINVEFKLPDADMREEIWKTHLLPNSGNNLRIPLNEDVDIRVLAEAYSLSGRNIRNSVVDACVEACRKGKAQVDMECLRNAAQRCMESTESALKAEDHTKVTPKGKPVELTKEEEDVLTEAIQKKLDEAQNITEIKP